MSEPMLALLIGFCMFGTGLALGLYEGFEAGFKEAKEKENDDEDY